MSKWVGRGGPVLIGPERLCCLPASDRELGGRYPTSSSHWLPLFQKALSLVKDLGSSSQQVLVLGMSLLEESPCSCRRSPQFDSTCNGL